MNDKLTTFAFVHQGNVISPHLVTTREYGRWLEAVYDQYTCNYELYVRATVGDTKVLEFHPGTRIGQYFDTTNFITNKYNSWYVYQESTMMNKLINMGLASKKDITVRDGLKLLRVYSVDQIELYVKTNIDRNFSIGSFIVEPKKITLRNSDMKNIIIPEYRKPKKSLLDQKLVPMTVADIEKQLGHKVSIIS